MHQWTKEDDQRVIDGRFDGNTKSYENALKRYRAGAMNFDDLSSALTTLPDYTERGLEEIIGRLGYLPLRACTLKHEPFIKVALQNCEAQLITWHEFEKECNEHVRQIRNKDLQHHSAIEYDAEDYKAYFKFLPEYSNRAKSRIMDFLGYEPHIDVYLKAELSLRRLMADDKFHFGKEMNPVDREFITLIKYREILIAKGKEAADNSPLINWY